MAKFSENYEVESNGGNTMSDNTFSGGAGLVGGLVAGGLLGYALSNWNGNGYGRGYSAPYPAETPIIINSDNGNGHGTDCYTTADVANLVATKDAQYAQLSATQGSEFEILNTMATNATANAKEMCGMAYENAMLNNQTQLQIAQNSAKSDLCCCQTQGKIAEIVPEIKNFYLQDEVSKLRGINQMQQIQCGFNSVNSNLDNIGFGVTAILNKLYNTTTTTAAA